MRKVIRLTESQLVKLIKEDIFYKRRQDLFNNLMDEAISQVTHEDLEDDSYEEYKSQVRWSTLGLYEGQFGEVKDIEGFFSLMKGKMYTDKMREGYKKFMGK
jgi:hypothetical protein